MCALCPAPVPILRLAIFPLLSLQPLPQQFCHLLHCFGAWPGIASLPLLGGSVAKMPSYGKVPDASKHAMLRC
jgi:hypothetical protein